MDEQRKQCILMAILVFNLIIIAFQIVFNSGLFGNEFSWLKLLIGLVVAAVAAGITYFVVQKTQN